MTYEDIVGAEGDESDAWFFGEPSGAGVEADSEPDADNYGKGDAETEPTTDAIFEGDVGGLDYPERLTLVALLKKRFISADQDADEWKSLMAHEREIRSRLNDLFFELVIDKTQQVAFKRQAHPDSDARTFTRLTKSTSWNRWATGLLVYLRVRARTDQSAGRTDSRVSRDELLEYLNDNRAALNNKRVSDASSASKAVDALESAGLLLKTSEKDVYRISPAIEVLLPVSTLVQLQEWMQKSVAKKVTDEGATPDADSAEDPE